MFLHDYKAAAVDRLKSFEFFTTGPAIDVMADDAQDLRSVMASQMSKLGVLVLICSLEAAVKNANLTVVRFEPMRFVARVRENPGLNRGKSGTGQPGDYVAQVVAMCLHGFKPSGQVTGSFVVESIAQGDDLVESIVPWDVIFSIPVALGSCDTAPERLDF